MTDQQDRAFLLIAITEEDSPAELMQSAIAALGESGRDVVALFFSDDRWFHAAALPVTCEISVLSGRLSQFTPERAGEVVREMAARARREFERLATEARVSLRFQIAPTETTDLERLLGSGRVTVIATSRFLRCRVYPTVKALRIEIVLADRQSD